MKETLYSLFGDSNKLSSKRVFGAIGYLCAIAMIAIWKHELIQELLYTSAALLGLGILERFKNGGKNDQIKQD